MLYRSTLVMCPFYNTSRMCNFDTDIGTEKLAHLEMVATIVHQLTKNLSMEQIEASGFRNYYVDHTVGIWPQAAGGVPFTAAQFQSTGDMIADLTEDIAAKQKARTAYGNILRLVRDEPDLYEPIKFLRAREIVHFQRFGTQTKKVAVNENTQNAISKTHILISQIRNRQKKLSHFYLLILCIF